MGSNNSLQLDAITRAAVERNTEIVAAALDAGDDLPIAVAAALSVMARQWRAQAAELLASTKRGKVSTAAALEDTATRVEKVADSLLTHRVDDVNSLIRAASEVAGVAVSLKVHGVEVAGEEAAWPGPDGGEPRPIPVPMPTPAPNPPTNAVPYCPDCDLDTHRCKGCGVPVEHGEVACGTCGAVLAPHVPTIPAQPMPKCGALPPYGPPAHGPCVKRAGHVERERAENPTVVVQHVSEGAKDLWAEPSEVPSAPESGSARPSWLPSNTEITEEIAKMTNPHPSTPPTGPPPMPRLVAVQPHPEAWTAAVRQAATENPAYALAAPGGMEARYPDGMPMMPALTKLSVGPSGPSVPVVVSPFVLPTGALALPSAMSWSREEELGSCGLKYRIKRESGDGQPEQPSWWLIGGSAVDAIVNEICRGVKVDYDPAQAFRDELAAEIARREVANPDWPIGSWKAADKGRQDGAWWREHGAVMCQNYYAWHIKREEDGWMVAGVQLSLEGSFIAGRPFLGYVDQVWIHQATRTLEIVDTKSGGTPANVNQLRHYAVALASFPNHAELLRTSTVRLATYDARNATLKQLGDGNPERHRPLVEFMVTSAWRQLEMEHFPANTNSGYGGCGSCAVRRACPVGSAT